VAVVTGGGRGIGRATAEALAAAGYRVVIAELRLALGRRVERALRRRGVQALALATDVADRASVRRAVAATLRRFGRIDCLVNNAGVLTPGPLARLGDRALDRMVDVNLRGPLLMSRAVLPAMRRRGSGAIVNVASQLGKTGIADYVTYCATKFGVVGFTEALADEVSDTGVRVWAVCPGLVDTAMARKTGVTARERSGLIRPESVARAIVDLATGRRRERPGSAVDVLR
jgi:meso-butanediol dehydrogenase/(S,S)-butanediol dehydrogenase/diacetyl reductase